MTKSPAPIYQLKVTLNDTHPPIWRRILAPGNTTLRKLHDILQIVMGWQDSHLHQFVIDGVNYGDPVVDEAGDLGLQSEARYKLSQLISTRPARFQYEYDFGDSWEHSVLLEKIRPPEPGVRYPLCLAGQRACPPEDVGGVWGYQSFLEALADPDNPEHDEYLEWSGGDFDPDAFDLEAVNASLRRMGRGRSTEAVSDWSPQEHQPATDLTALAAGWMHLLSDDQLATAENLPLRRDMLALLTYLRDNRITGTQATGNLPLKAVHEICARFVNPPKLEETIGDQVFPIRSETQVWPLYFPHVLASVAALVVGGPARRIRLTPLGEQFVSASASVQVWLMLATWWTRVNWAIAWHYWGPSDLPGGFSGATLKQMLALPVGERVAFDPFADWLIAAARWVWPIPDQASARTILHGLVGRIVIGPLRDFGILTAEYVPDPVLGPEYHKLSAFRVTPFGHGLLLAIGKANKPE